MKVIIATPLYPPEIEDISLYSKEVMRYLKDEYQISILAYANQVELDSAIDIKVINKQQPLFIRLFKYTWELFKMSKGADLIYVQNAVASGLPAIIVKYLNRVPVLVNFAEDEAWKRASYLNLTEKSFEEFLQDKDFNRKTKWLMRLQGWVLRRASKVVVSSRTLAELVTDIYRVAEEDISFNYRPENRKQKLPFELILKEKQVFVSGPLVDWSGIDNVIKAMEIVCDKFPKANLVISGDGPAKTRLVDLVDGLALKNNINFVGKISKAQNWYLRKTSQVYVHNFEGLDIANRITQSFLAGIPVIAKDTKINREIFSNNQCGLLIKTDKVEDLALEIMRIFKDQGLAQELSINAKQVLENKFSWTAHINKLNNIFASLIRK